ncbi:MAG: YlxM family DNA-binding protein [Bacillota bacterium]
MERIFKTTLLFDFYGELLTKKQKQVFSLHYQDDLSFTEISEELEITRQGVHDQLKRTEKILLGYEEKLKLVERFLHQHKSLSKIQSIIESMTFQPTEENQNGFSEIMELIDDVLEND